MLRNRKAYRLGQVRRGRRRDGVRHLHRHVFLGGRRNDETARRRRAGHKKEMLSILLGIQTVDLSNLPKDTVLVAEELTPSMTACIDKSNVVGFVTEVGSKTSHAAILARAMEIPAVLSLKNACEVIKSGQLTVVDGVKGEVITEPSNDVTAEYIRLRVDFDKEKAALKKFAGKETVTADGQKVMLFANIGTPDDALKVSEYDGGNRPFPHRIPLYGQNIRSRRAGTV